MIYVQGLQFSEYARHKNNLNFCDCVPCFKIGALYLIKTAYRPRVYLRIHVQYRAVICLFYTYHWMCCRTHEFLFWMQIGTIQNRVLVQISLYLTHFLHYFDTERTLTAVDRQYSIRQSNQDHRVCLHQHNSLSFGDAVLVLLVKMTKHYVFESLNVFFKGTRGLL